MEIIFSKMNNIKPKRHPILFAVWIGLLCSSRAFASNEGAANALAWLPDLSPSQWCLAGTAAILASIVCMAMLTAPPVGGNWFTFKRVDAQDVLIDEVDCDVTYCRSEKALLKKSQWTLNENACPNCGAAKLRGNAIAYYGQNNLYEPDKSGNTGLKLLGIRWRSYDVEVEKGGHVVCSACQFEIRHGAGGLKKIAGHQAAA